MMVNRLIKKCREYSLPLICGVIAALVWANVSPERYDDLLHMRILSENVTFHFLVNDIFMLFFFAMAGVEIVVSLSKGGSLSPINKAVTPLMATAGGVLGPIAVFFILNAMIGNPNWINGWGIPTATDIALAWLVARMVFGKNHPAVSFLLLLAVADDGIGLIIIAVFYPDPNYQAEPLWLLLVVSAMLIAYLFKNTLKLQSFWPYILFCGSVSWLGMYNAHLHPALALVFIIPFLPQANEHSTLQRFEHTFSPFVDFGLFFFGLSNAGVAFSGLSNLTWIIALSLLIGKVTGIFCFSLVSIKLLRFKLPDGMGLNEVFVAGIVAAMGLTVALFVAGVAYTDADMQGAAKMGALLTAFVSVLAITAGKLLKIKKM